MGSPDDVVGYARSRGLPVKLFSDLGSVRTVVEASARMDRPPADIGNTVLVTVRGEPYLVVVPGDRRVDGAKIAHKLAARTTEVSLATQDEVQEITGFEIGCVPPFGHERPVPLLVDKHVLETPTILLPSGATDALIEVNTRALATLSNAEVGLWSAAMDQD